MFGFGKKKKEGQKKDLRMLLQERLAKYEVLTEPLKNNELTRFFSNLRLFVRNKGFKKETGIDGNMVDCLERTLNGFKLGRRELLGMAAAGLAVAAIPSFPNPASAQGNSDAMRYFREGFALGEQGRYGEALQKYQAAKALNPPVTHNINYSSDEAKKLHRDAMSQDEKNPDLAISLFEKIKEIETQHPQPDYNIGWVFKKFKNDPNSAEKHFKFSLQKNPLYLDPYLSLANLYFEENLKEKSLFFYKIAEMFISNTKYRDFIQQRLAILH